ncbi:MAG: GNAT family N-acetyltransferase [Anaerolineae bacterium]
MKSIDLQEVILAEEANNLIGAVHYHHRLDKQTTLYHIAVARERRREKVGRLLIDTLLVEGRHLQMQKILLKCPEELAANVFYAAVGFKLSGVEAGKHRRLNVWIYEISDPLTR